MKIWWIEWVTALIQVVPIVFGVYKAWQAFLDQKFNIVKETAKRDVMVAQAKVDEAKQLVEAARQGSLTAGQIADIISKHQFVLEQLEEIKDTSSDNRKELIQKVDNIENLVRDQMRELTKFIMGKAHTTEQN